MARREHSHYELQRKLSAKGYDSSSIAEELSRLLAERLLDDARFAESYAYHRAKRGFGPNRLRAELRERGVADSIVESTLETADFDWESIILATWQKKFGRAPTNYPEKAKQARFLEYRGFDGGAINDLLAKIRD